MSLMLRDDELTLFEAHGPAPLPADGVESSLLHDGARIWYATYGSGPPVILLHGGMGNSRNFGNQVAPLLAAGRRVVLIDSRGHGRSTRDTQPYSYELMAGDVLAVMDTLQLDRAAFVGWSDGACTAIALAKHHAERVAGVFFFGCNVDPTGTKPFEFTPVIGRCLSRHKKDYAELSATPGEFDAFANAVGQMQRTQPNYSAADLASISVPVTIVHAEHDEFITPEHAAYLARSVPGASLVRLPGVSHFAPIQRPDEFNAAVLGFLRELSI